MKCCTVVAPAFDAAWSSTGWATGPGGSRITAGIAVASAEEPAVEAAVVKEPAVVAVKEPAVEAAGAGAA